MMNVAQTMRNLMGKLMVAVCGYVTASATCTTAAEDDELQLRWNPKIMVEGTYPLTKDQYDKRRSELQSSETVVRQRRYLVYQFPNSMGIEYWVSSDCSSVRVPIYLCGIPRSLAMFGELPVDWLQQNVLCLERPPDAIIELNLHEQRNTYVDGDGNLIQGILTSASTGDGVSTTFYSITFEYSGNAQDTPITMGNAAKALADAIQCFRFNTTVQHRSVFEMALRSSVRNRILAAEHCTEPVDPVILKALRLDLATLKALPPDDADTSDLSALPE
ncbi:MAG: hypothetical protein LBR78_02470 [Holosporales bacterium]|jgi:hypothetical protein|nr:hypothetical protein [Holosporales bacterium]